MDWPLSRHVERQAQRLNDMIARVDADPLQLVRLRQGDAFIEARKNCLECRHATICLDWLGHPKRADERAEFCPNQELLQSVKRCER